MSERFELLGGETRVGGQDRRRPRRALPPRRRRGGRRARSSRHPGAVGDRGPRRASTSGSCASRARPSASPALLEIPAGQARRRGRAAARDRRSASWPRRSASGAAQLGADPRLRSDERRASPTSASTCSSRPSLRDARRRAATRTSASRSCAGRWTDLDDAIDECRGREVADRAALAARAAPERLDCTARAPTAARAGCTGGTRGPGPNDGAMTAGQRHAPARPYEHLVLDFLAYLEFERGLSRNTLEAYRSDLLQFGAYLDSVAASTRSTPTHGDARRLPGRAGRGRRRAPAGRAGHAAAQDRLPALLLPPPAPRGAASTHDPTAELRAPAQAPAAAARPHPRRGRSACSSSPAAPSPPRCATARCSSSCTPAGCAPRRRSGSSSPTSTSRPACCAPAARAPRSGSCPIGREAIARAARLPARAAARRWSATRPEPRAVRQPPRRRR